MAANVFSIQKHRRLWKTWKAIDLEIMVPICLMPMRRKGSLAPSRTIGQSTKIVLLKKATVDFETDGGLTTASTVRL